MTHLHTWQNALAFQIFYILHIDSAVDWNLGYIIFNVLKKIFQIFLIFDEISYKLASVQEKLIEKLNKCNDQPDFMHIK